MLPPEQRRRVLIVGQGYVGLPLADAAVRAGHHVLALDTDDAKVADLHAFKSPIEDVTDADLKDMLGTGRYELATYADSFRSLPFHVAIVTVPTPLRDGRPDLGYVLDAARSVGHLLYDTVRRTARMPLVVLESTVAPGTTRGVFTRALEEASSLRAGVDFHVAFSPERIDPGNKAWNFSRTPKLVGGATPEATTEAAVFYRTICAQIHQCATPDEAEAAKLWENTYRQVNIALANEMGHHLRAMGIDPWNVVRAAATKPYGFQPFFPGPGVGGHCIPVDPAYLEEAIHANTGASFDFVRLATRINRAQPSYVVQRITGLLNQASRAVKGSEILVIGAAYKRDTGDLRESPAVEVIEHLARLGADVTVYEPHAASDALGYLRVSGGTGTVWTLAHVDDLRRRMADGFHLAVILTDHTDVPYDDIVRAMPMVLDTRGALNPGDNVAAL